MQYARASKPILSTDGALPFRVWAPNGTPILYIYIDGQTSVMTERPGITMEAELVR